MYNNTKFVNWQIENKLYLKSVFNIIINNLKEKKIEIRNEEKLRVDIIKYIYNKI